MLSPRYVRHRRRATIPGGPRWSRPTESAAMKHQPSTSCQQDEDWLIVLEPQDERPGPEEAASLGRTAGQAMGTLFGQAAREQRDRSFRAPRRGRTCET